MPTEAPPAPPSAAPAPPSTAPPNMQPAANITRRPQRDMGKPISRPAKDLSDAFSQLQEVAEKGDSLKAPPDMAKQPEREADPNQPPPTRDRTGEAKVEGKAE